MKNKTFKQNQKVYCLYVNSTAFYVSFKIEQGKFLGEAKNNIAPSGKIFYVVEHYDDDIDYLQMKDIFATEEQAKKHLSKILLVKKIK